MLLLAVEQTKARAVAGVLGARDEGGPRAYKVRIPLVAWAPYGELQLLAERSPSLLLPRNARALMEAFLLNLSRVCVYRSIVRSSYHVTSIQTHYCYGSVEERCRDVVRRAPCACSRQEVARGIRTVETGDFLLFSFLYLLVRRLWLLVVGFVFYREKKKKWETTKKIMMKKNILIQVIKYK